MSASLHIASHYTQSEYVAYLLRRKESIERLSAAVREYLLDNLDELIASAEDPPPTMAPLATIEDLEKAHRDVELMRDGLAAFENFMGDLPDTTAEFLNVTQKPAIMRQLEMAEKRVSEIQEQLEAPRDPEKPWLGKMRMTMACAQCAKPSASSDYSTKTLNAKVFDEGWRRDPDGDWICQSCTATALASVQSESTVDPNKKESL